MVPRDFSSDNGYQMIRAHRRFSRDAQNAPACIPQPLISLGVVQFYIFAVVNGAVDLDGELDWADCKIDGETFDRHLPPDGVPFLSKLAERLPRLALRQVCLLAQAPGPAG